MHDGSKLRFFGEHAALAQAAAFKAWLAPLRRCEWVVYAKRPFAGPQAVLAYLSRYTHRVAISNSRLLAMDEFAIQKGHRYATVVVDPERKRVLWVGRGRSRAEIRPFFEALIREGVLVRVAGVHVYRKTIQYIGAVIQSHFAVQPTLSVGEFRDLLHTTRRWAVPLLEYLDANKYTVRKDDMRLKGPNLHNLSE